MTRRTTGRAACAAWVVAVLLLLAGTSATAPADVTVGLQDWTMPDDRAIAAVAAAGITRWRVVVDWSAVESRRGTLDWRAYDALAARAARRQVRLLPVLLGCPAGRCPTALTPPIATADRRSGWSRFVRAFAARYGRGGAFWSAHPDVPVVPVVEYQVWNEPNLRGYWAQRPHPGEYLSLVRRTASLVRSRDPAARIVLAGLAESRTGTPVRTYLAALLRRRGATAAFDVAALNAYATTAGQAVQGTLAIRGVLDAGGARRRPLWITEIGWSSSGPANPFRTTRAGQASRLASLIDGLDTLPRARRIDAVYPFALQDRRLRQDEAPWWGPHTGLFDVLGRPKPAWASVARRAGGSAGGTLTPRPPTAVPTLPGPDGVAAGRALSRDPST